MLGAGAARIFTCIYDAPERARAGEHVAVGQGEKKGYVRHLQYAVRRHGEVRAEGEGGERVRSDGGECSGPRRHRRRATDGEGLEQALMRSRPASQGIEGEEEEDKKDCVVQVGLVGLSWLLLMLVEGR